MWRKCCAGDTDPSGKGWPAAAEKLKHNRSKSVNHQAHAAKDVAQVLRRRDSCFQTPDANPCSFFRPGLTLTSKGTLLLLP
jgi:hypothetical protein